jgi:hypothetical protein
MRSTLTRREFGKIILGASPLVLAPQLAMAAAKEIFGVPVGSVKAIDGVPIGSIKEYMGVEVISKTCQVYTANSTSDTTFEIFYYNTAEYYGMIFDDASAGSICGLDLYIHNMSGTPANLGLYAEVWLLGASDALSSLVTNGRSSKVDGAAWSAQLVSFTFPTPPAYDCTGTNQYGLLFKAVANADAAATAGKWSTTDYARTRRNTASNTMNHCVAIAQWSASGSLNNKNTGRMPYMTVRTMQ